MERPSLPVARCLAHLNVMFSRFLGFRDRGGAMPYLIESFQRRALGASFAFTSELAACHGFWTAQTKLRAPPNPR